ncbi:hypothetical protein [Cohnella sp. GCM10012308]|uniref:hypothetical protein n=1 Tax=Cohnella sp. GCM10012308 TaxID=3317329 RepID=UPI003610362B
MNKSVAIFENMLKSQNTHINLIENFTHLRGYHGCRPTSVESYYQNGIIPIEKEFAKQDAIIRLCNEQVSVSKVLSTFETAWSTLPPSDKSVWLTFSQEELINFCGHYLIYGSEFLCGIAAQLFCQHNLKKVGTPTIFFCDIPLSNIPVNYLSDIEQKFRRRDASGGFRVNNKVLPKEIVGHSHPTSIPDPINGGIYH